MNMKICKFTLLAIVFGAIFATTNSNAANLMDVYEKALANDPTFKAARATWLTDKETLAINRADLLPILKASGNIARTRGESENSHNSGSRGYNNSLGYSLTLAQPIFNFGSWVNVWYAQAIAKQAKATYMAEEESLLMRTAKAYFGVLLAKDILSYSKAKKASMESSFIQAKHKFDVGLIPITDLEDARKEYDLAVSEEIGNNNDLNNKLEKLNEITGVRYNDLAQVKNSFPLLSPKPADIEQWVKAAEKQNFTLTAARYDAIAAREVVKKQNAGHLPTLSAEASYGYDYSNHSDDRGGFSRSKNATAGLQLEVPIFNGGKVIASAKQADYVYQKKLAIQEKIYRSVVSETRQAYLGVLSKISKIRADLQAIKSAASSVRATKASYTVGTRTMADVLKSQTQLYEAQKTFATDEYDYIIQLLTLKELTGILDSSDLAQINSWLEKAKSIEKEDKTAIPATKHPTKKKTSKVTTGYKNPTNKKPNPALIVETDVKTTVTDNKETTINTESFSPKIISPQQEGVKETNTTSLVATPESANPSITATTINAPLTAPNNIKEIPVANTTAANTVAIDNKTKDKLVVLGTQKIEEATSGSNEVTSTSVPNEIPSTNIN